MQFLKNCHINALIRLFPKLKFIRFVYEFILLCKIPKQREDIVTSMVF